MKRFLFALLLMSVTASAQYIVNLGPQDVRVRLATVPSNPVPLVQLDGLSNSMIQYVLDASNYLKAISLTQAVNGAQIISGTTGTNIFTALALSELEGGGGGALQATLDLGNTATNMMGLGFNVTNPVRQAVDFGPGNNMAGIHVSHTNGGASRDAYLMLEANSRARMVLAVNEDTSGFENLTNMVIMEVSTVSQGKQRFKFGSFRSDAQIYPWLQVDLDDPTNLNWYASRMMEIHSIEFKDGSKQYTAATNKLKITTNSYLWSAISITNLSYPCLTNVQQMAFGWWAGQSNIIDVPLDVRIFPSLNYGRSNVFGMRNPEARMYVATVTATSGVNGRTLTVSDAGPITQWSMVMVNKSGSGDWTGPIFVTNRAGASLYLGTDLLECTATVSAVSLFTQYFPSGPFQITGTNLPIEINSGTNVVTGTVKMIVQESTD